MLVAQQSLARFWFQQLQLWNAAYCVPAALCFPRFGGGGWISIAVPNTASFIVCQEGRGVEVSVVVVAVVVDVLTP